MHGGKFYEFQMREREMPQQDIDRKWEMVNRSVDENEDMWI